MKAVIEVNNLTAVRIKKDSLKKIAAKVLKAEKKRISELSIALVGQKLIKKLNRKYRRKNKATDVLSFSGELNEIVICPKEVKKNAERFNSIFEKELAQVLIHGVLHLLGYDHEATKKEARKMVKKQENYLKLFFK
jgi:probable rRNA maturation factor